MPEVPFTEVSKATEVPFAEVREVLRTAYERLVGDLVANRQRPGGDGVTVEFEDEGFRHVFGTSRFNLVADINLRVLPQEPVTELTSEDADSA